MKTRFRRGRGGGIEREGRNRECACATVFLYQFVIAPECIHFSLARVRGETLEGADLIAILQRECRITRFAQIERT